MHALGMSTSIASFRPPLGHEHPTRMYYGPTRYDLVASFTEILLVPLEPRSMSQHGLVGASADVKDTFSSK